MDVDATLTERIAQAYEQGPALADDKHTKNLTFMEGLWWDKNLIVVPNCRTVTQLIFHDCRDAATAGHLGVRKTVQHIQRYFTRPNVWAEAEAYVRHCPSCQVNKGSSAKPKGLRQPVEVPPYP